MLLLLIENWVLVLLLDWLFHLRHLLSGRDTLNWIVVPIGILLIWFLANVALGRLAFLIH